MAHVTRVLVPMLVSLCISSAVSQQMDSAAQAQMQKMLEAVNTASREIDAKLKTAREHGNRLTEFEALRSLEPEYSTKEEMALGVLSLIETEMAAELGNYADALRYADIGAQKPIAFDSSALVRLQSAQAVHALAALENISDRTQIVLINEAHHVPQHRAFTIELLHLLRKKGFTYFAAEALSIQDSLLNERHYPVLETGTYTDEPVYGDLVRTALRLGYRLVPYEYVAAGNPAPGNRADHRERGQATNLIERILNSDPKAKFIVHAGYSHINESGRLAGAPTMAQRLKEFSGIDPLTIDQTLMTEHGAPEFEHPLYRLVLEQQQLTEPTVFRNGQGGFWTYTPGKHDITLFHPRTHYQYGRPVWLSLHGSRTPYHLPAGLFESNSQINYLVRARVAGESEVAIPIDQIVVQAGKDIPALMLPPGEFMIEVEDATGRRIKTFDITHQ